MYNYNLGLLFSEVASTHSYRPALNCPDKCFSYEDIACLVDAFSCLLINNGCRCGDVVAIGHNKHPLSYALMLACLRLGVTYVNIDVASPVTRLKNILNISGAALLFYDDLEYKENMELLASNSSCGLLFVEKEQLPTVSLPDIEQQKKLMASVDSSTIAYIMFTSGSTGIPKGVAVTHQNVLNFIAWGKGCFGVTEKDNFANLSPMYFDNSVFDFYVGLFSGASLTPIPRKLMTRPYELVPFVEKMACSIWFSVPSLLIYLVTMKAINASVLPGLRTIIFGGEGYPKVELKKLYDFFHLNATLVNVYGPTECTCICSAHILNDSDFEDLAGLPTLGKLNENFDFQILDESDEVSSIGELCLIGPNVAAGYFNDTEKTAIVFQTLIEPNYFMKRMYRTGDLVREENGNLYFVGRKDNQIKHMGYRIELEEIEQALVKLPQVDQAIVVYHRSNTAYGKLVAFVSCVDEVSTQYLLAELEDVLPDYMIPQHINVMAKLPKNPNGKVDRSGLLATLNM